MLTYLPNLGILIACYKVRIPGFPRKSIREGASSLLEGRRVPNMSLALGQPQGCTGASLGCSRARVILGSLRPSPKRLLAPSLIHFRRNPGIRALYQAIGIAMKTEALTQMASATASVLTMQGRRRISVCTGPNYTHVHPPDP